ncbi:DUF6000 family protein [Hymenobacter swuensis]|uniref:DUF6000 family protein n=1 Tax=Hymenobacter swuensis TaxID=1446467 RepID=UPI000694FE01|nr:DUF6000 family protein [Hymenobacter swuensis]
MWDQTLFTKWVKPLYMEILHANYTGTESTQQLVAFNQQVNTALASVDEYIITHLLKASWREKLTGSWLCGLKNWQQFVPLLGTLLVESKTMYAGQGYCFALARFATAESATYLAVYLDTYLRQPDLQYDQHWAMPALLWIDERRGTTWAQEFLVPGGLWEQYTANKLDHSIIWQLTECKRQFWAAMEYCRTNFDSGEQSYTKAQSHM